MLAWSALPQRHEVKGYAYLDDLHTVERVTGTYFPIMPG
jgi:hypothetical protein